MSAQKAKQFGIWMDSQHATVIGRDNTDNGNFQVIFSTKSEKTVGNSSENTGNNHEKGNLQKYFKAIAAVMPNAEEIHVTGPGTVQEQFIKYMAETPQYKNTKASESTSTKMSDEKLVEFFEKQFK